MDKLIRELTLEEESLVSGGMNHGYNHDVHDFPANLLPHRPINERQNGRSRESWKGFQYHQQNQRTPYTYGCNKDKRKRCLNGNY